MHQPNQTRQRTPIENALAVLDYIDSSLTRRAQAAQLYHSVGGTVIGRRMSILELPPESIAIDVNPIIVAMGGILASIDGEPIRLLQWLGPNQQVHGEDMWFGQHPHNPRLQASVSVDPLSLRAELESQMYA